MLIGSCGPDSGVAPTRLPTYRQSSLSSSQPRGGIGDAITTKNGEYLEAGGVEYWIVDRFHRRMTVYRNPSEQDTEVVVDEQDTY